MAQAMLAEYFQDQFRDQDSVSGKGDQGENSDKEQLNVQLPQFKVRDQKKFKDERGWHVYVLLEVRSD